MIKEAIKYLTEGKDLTKDLMRSSMLEIMEGVATPAQIASFLTSLKMKTETAEEIAFAAEVMKEKAIPIKVDTEKLIDTCGTGGDGLYTFNISTLVALSLSAYGIPVAKHGNRSVSSSCGSADLIEALGIPLNIDRTKIETAIKEIKFGYIFAPACHLSMKYATPVRRELGIRTIFNILGPLVNPASPNYQILGVYDAKLLDPIINALKKLKLKSALVVHAQDGMDEISLSSLTEARLLKDNTIENLMINPEDFGFKKVNMAVFKVKDLAHAKSKALKVLKGEKGPELEIVAFNSGWSLFVLDEVKNPKDGYLIIKELLKSGKVFEKLEQIRKFFSNVNSN